MSHFSAIFYTDSMMLEQVESKDETPSSSGDLVLNSSHEEVILDSETKETYNEQISCKITARKKSWKPDEHDNIPMKKKKINAEEDAQNINTSVPFTPGVSKPSTSAPESSLVDSPEISAGEKPGSDYKSDTDICDGISEAMARFHKFFEGNGEKPGSDYKSDTDSCDGISEAMARFYKFYEGNGEGPGSDDESDASSSDGVDSGSDYNSGTSSDGYDSIEESVKAYKELCADPDAFFAKAIEKKKSPKEMLANSKGIFNEIENATETEPDFNIDAEFQKAFDRKVDVCGKIRKDFLRKLQKIWKKMCVAKNTHFLDYDTETKTRSLLYIIYFLRKRKVSFSEDDRVIAYLFLLVIKAIVKVVEFAVVTVEPRVYLVRKRKALQYLMKTFGEMQVKGQNLIFFLEKPYKYCDYLLDEVLERQPLLKYSGMFKYIY